MTLKSPSGEWRLRPRTAWQLASCLAAPLGSPHSQAADRSEAGEVLFQAVTAGRGQGRRVPPAQDTDNYGRSRPGSPVCSCSWDLWAQERTDGTEPSQDLALLSALLQRWRPQHPCADRRLCPSRFMC